MYSNKADYSHTIRTLVRTHLNKDEKPVQNGLALTPSDIALMTAQGIPVSTQALETMYAEGTTLNTFDVPLEQQRGVDAADLFQAAESSKKRISQARKKVSSYASKLIRKASINAPDKIQTT